MGKKETRKPANDGFSAPAQNKTAREKKADNAANRKTVISAVCVILVIALCIGVTVYTKIADSGYFYRTTISVKSDNYEVNNAMMSYFLNVNYQQMSSSLSQMGVDTKTSLKEQNYPYSTGMTWFDYFMKNVTVPRVENMLVLCEAAKAAGFELDEHEQSHVEESMQSLEESLKSYSKQYGGAEGYYLRNIYGYGVTLADVRAALEISQLASAYSAHLIEQYDYYGMYHNGFINSILGQRDVTVTTDGYNYIAEGDDVYLYTGVTSVGGDESNVGFLLSNQRTKETKYYPCAGATEYSAMDSAEGQVQNLRYTATFPLLLNVAEQPTYFMALKDASELVKMYAMVNVNQYQIVATGATVAECESNYRQMLRQSNLISDDQTGIDQPVETDRRSLEGVIAEIRSAVVDGNSIYFLRFTGETDFTVRMSAADVPYAPLLNVGDRVRVWYYDGHVSEFWIEACDLELLPVSTPAEPDDAQPSGGADA